MERKKTGMFEKANNVDISSLRSNEYNNHAFTMKPKALYNLKVFIMRTRCSNSIKNFEYIISLHDVCSL